MAPIPTQFRRTGEVSLVNYDYTDIAQGTGVVVFDGYVTDESNGSTTFSPGYYMAQTPPYATLSANNYTSFTPNSTVTFSTGALSKPMTLYGTAYINMNISVPAAPAGAGYITVSILKNSTVLVSANTEGWNTGDGTQRPILRLSVPKTKIKIGDEIKVSFLRVTISGTAPSFTVYCDPSNRTGWDGTATPTRLIMGIPFKVET